MEFQNNSARYAKNTLLDMVHCFPFKKCFENLNLPRHIISLARRKQGVVNIYVCHSHRYIVLLKTEIIQINQN